MDVAFFIDQINEDPRTLEIFNGLNEDIENGNIKNGSVFFKDVGPNPVEPKFSLFNSTDIWYYTGTLVATTMETFVDAFKAINNYKLVYLFSRHNKHDVFGLISISKQFKILTKTEEDQKEVYRLTGKKPPLLPDIKPSTIERAIT
tara:strand:+ start:101 stop:538 length:438 start_codon:yes stop_codon:yes gene_type:complete